VAGGRDPWRLGTHALVTGDARSLAQIRRMAQWIFTATGGDPLAAACMTNPARQEFLNDLYEAVKQSGEGYYEDTLTALCLLVLSGNWWTFSTRPTSASLSTTPGAGSCATCCPDRFRQP